MQPTEPTRLQLSRRNGFDLQALSRSTNGLPAVVVSRPTRWGNPFKVGAREPDLRAESAWAARDLYKDHLLSGRHGLNLLELRGKNLACWCPLVDKQGRPVPCHADVLLDLANR